MRYTGRPPQHRPRPHRLRRASGCDSRAHRRSQSRGLRVSFYFILFYRTFCVRTGTIIKSVLFAPRSNQKNDTFYLTFTSFFPVTT